MPRKHKRRKFFDKKFISQERRKTRLMLFILFWGIIFTWFAKTFVVNLEVILGPSMYPTLEEGGFHLANKFIYSFKEPERRDIVIIESVWLKKDQLNKRVIAVPGDTIYMRKGNVYLNGTLLDEPYVRGRTFPSSKPLKLEKDLYFVMGDNREISDDSRQFGPIMRKEIRGKLAPDELFILK